MDDSEEHIYYDTWNINQYPVRNEQWDANQNATNEPIYANIHGEVQNASQNNTNEPVYGNIQEEAQNDINEPLYDNLHVTHWIAWWPERQVEDYLLSYKYDLYFAQWLREQVTGLLVTPAYLG